jgi:hypothetical protein
LIDALGPIKIPETTEAITGDNLVEFARNSWSPENGNAENDWWSHRKDFMSDILAAAIENIKGGLNKEQMIGLSKAILTAFQQKHLQIYLKDNNGAALALDFGWDGSQKQYQGDYLSVIDTNVGFNKTNTVVDESYTYQVDLRDQFAPEATLIINHKHTLDNLDIVCQHEPRYNGAYEEMIERCYWDYLRVYIPTGSTLLDASPHEVPGQYLLSGIDNPATVQSVGSEYGRDFFATLFLLKPGESLETLYNYSLPVNILKVEKNISSYQLLVQKQSGTENVPIEIQIMLPPKSKIISTEPSTCVENKNGLVFNLYLNTDKKVELVYKAP